MSFISSFFRFLNRIKSDDGDYDLSSRWVHYSNGLILDSNNSGQAVWMVGSIWFEKWFHSLEEKLELSLGKRLIQASSEELEYYLASNKIHAPKNNNIDAIKNYLRNNGVSKVMTKKLKKYVLICDAEVQEFFRSMNTLYFKNIQIEFFRLDQRELALAAVRT